MNVGLPAFLRCKHIVVLLLCTLSISRVFAQKDTLRFAANTTQFSTAVVHEKIYAHTDKNVYTGGEIIWFKLYVIEASSHRLLDISKVAYAEVLDKKSKAVLQAKITLQKGTGNGSFFIPPGTRSGHYIFRAYTSWMKNFPATSFFEKKLTVYNVQSKPDVPVTQDSTNAYSIQFFPEGGNLMEGLPNKIAFKGSDKQGKAIAFTGSLLDGNTPLLTFRSGFDGMGSFRFIPQKNHQYKCSVQTETGNLFFAALPTIEREGYILSLEKADTNNVSFIIRKSQASEDVYLLAHTNQAIISAKKIRLQDSVKVVFKKALLPDGISTFTLFTADKKPVCERLYFKRPEHILPLSLSSDKDTYGLRSEVNFQTAIGNFQKDSSRVQASLAVYQLDSLQSPDETTIDNYLLFSSELMGPIEHPAHYFSSKTNDVSDDLDNLLLINGWRKFQAKNIVQNTKPVFTYAPEYNGHIITGQVRNERSGQPAAGVDSYLSLPGIRTQFYPCKSDSGGRVHFETSASAGSGEIIMQTKPQNTTAYTIQIDDPFSQQPTSRLTDSTLSFPLNTLLKHRIHMQAQNIYNAKKLARFSAPADDTTAFYLHADASYSLENYTRFTTLEEVMREYVALVNVTKREGKFHLPVFDITKQAIMTNDPLVLIDGVPVFNMDRFLSFDPLKLKKLDVVHRSYLLGNDRFDGILNWQSYNGNFTDFDLDPKAVRLDYDGLQEQRIFYSPAYQTEAQRSRHQPDFRQVLYWNPDITISSDSLQNIRFYTSDVAGKFIAVLQGISEKGQCGSKTIFFTVGK